MAASWCKVASDLDSHPKIRKAGRNGREVFLFALRRNASLDLGGVIPADHMEPWFLADQLMMTEEEAVSGLSRAVQSGLLAINGNSYSILGWDSEWAKRPLTEAERKARQRAKSDTLDSNHSNVTAMSGHDRDCPESHGSEERRGEEKRVEKEDSEAINGPGFVLNSEPKPKKGRPPKVKPSGPTEPERATAMRILARLGERNGTRYTGSAEHVRLIVRQLRDGVSEFELRAVIAYCAVDMKWVGDERMEKYLQPSTLFGPISISKYLDPARTKYAAEIERAKAEAA